MQKNNKDHIVMMKNVTLNMNSKLFWGIKKRQFIILIFIITVVTANAVFSQEKEYVVTGRVVDESGKPVSSAYVNLAGLVYGCCPDSLETDKDGRFSKKGEVPKGKVLYLYTSQWAENVQDGIDFISAPFFEIGKLNKRFLGMPIKFGKKTSIDVGDVPVMFRYGNAFLKLQKNGKNLTEYEWKHLWLILIDENGKILKQQSIAPTVKADEIDLDQSVLKLVLPEGKWKMQFSRFDYPNKHYEEIIGETPYFEIDKNKETEIVNVSVKNLN